MDPLTRSDHFCKALQQRWSVFQRIDRPGRLKFHGLCASKRAPGRPGGSRAPCHSVSHSGTHFGPHAFLRDRDLCPKWVWSGQCCMHAFAAPRVPSLLLYVALGDCILPSLSATVACRSLPISPPLSRASTPGLLHVGCRQPGQHSQAQPRLSNSSPQQRQDEPTMSYQLL